MHLLQKSRTQFYFDNCEFDNNFFIDYHQKLYDLIFNYISVEIYSILIRMEVWKY